MKPWAILAGYKSIAQVCRVLDEQVLKEAIDHLGNGQALRVGVRLSRTCGRCWTWRGRSHAGANE